MVGSHRHQQRAGGGRGLSRATATYLWSVVSGISSFGLAYTGSPVPGPRGRKENAAPAGAAEVHCLHRARAGSACAVTAAGMQLVRGGTHSHSRRGRNRTLEATPRCPLQKVGPHTHTPF